ncbi:MAG: BON domain-containing protein [Flavobacteriales bacterium]|nr:BON domain-containing protein [Flavobacteriales bacterium]
MKKIKRKIKKNISSFLIVLSSIILSTTFCYTALAKNNPSNQTLYTKVMEKLKFEPSLEESNITIALKNNGIVVLGGKVGSYTEKLLAEIAVEKITTVKGVANEIEVELQLSDQRSDVDIVEAALNALKKSVNVPHKKIKIAVDNGWVTLSGEVDYNYQREYAMDVIEDLYGVVTIINAITLKPIITPSAVKEKITKEFERNARIDANNIQVLVDGNKVILIGNVKNFDEYREAILTAWSIPGIINVEEQLSIDW